ncbi:hypothetical protein AVEN_81514-1 [Araneus ventricosus]|uniref:Uncharacterized protein n=1 Tax=Araneus ventricosus TaxID=182803 RepID=A0A4Y2EKA9_ARAVE|nr:hypothetical protein AVEN_71763-1 [Araneus ventricosus]GBM28598.1 hypothetical protein AVEN_81514-1 [Araneus ventricosus]
MSNRGCPRKNHDGRYLSIAGGVQPLLGSLESCMRSNEAEFYGLLFPEGYTRGVFTRRPAVCLSVISAHGAEDIDFGLEIDEMLFYSLMSLGSS